VELLSEKKKNRVQPVKDQAQSPEDIDSVPEKSESAPIPVDLSSIDPKKIEMAEKLGIPIGQIIQWMSSVEERFKIIQTEMPDVIVKKITEIAQQRQKQYQQQMQNPQTQGGGGIAGSGVGVGDLAGIINAVSGGGGADPMVQAMTTAMMNKALVGIDLSNALTKAVIVKIAPEMAKDLFKG